MKNEIQLFKFQEHEVRTVKEEDGQVWFVAKDVADILEFRDAFNATRLLDDDEKGTQKVSTPSGEQMTTIISESGLYTLIMRSNKPEAKQFRKWVTSEVLPTLRKTGSYSTVPVVEAKEEIALPVPEELVSVEATSDWKDGNYAMLAAEIVKGAFHAKEDKEYREILALDKLFKEFTGKSALEIVGMSIKKRRWTEKYQFVNEINEVKKEEYELKQEDKDYGCEAYDYTPIHVPL